MMISVTERTREIGVRKVLGATRATILWQFLVEAVTLTSIGATVGLVLGILTAVGIRTAWPAIPASTPVPDPVRRDQLVDEVGAAPACIPRHRHASYPNA